MRADILTWLGHWPHSGFVYLSYGLSFIVITLLIVYTVYDSKNQKRKLAALEAAGIKRRSMIKESANMP